MASQCCEKKSAALEELSKQQSKVLWIVLAINLVMFVIEILASLHADSLALMGDSLDMLGDSLAYGASLYVVNMGAAAKARSAILKGWIILLTAIFIVGASVYRSIYREVPLFEVMSIVGLLALIANLVCLMLLTRFKNADINMQSVWLCSRNDIIANVSVLAAAGLVFYTQSPWPDLVVGISLAILFTKSAIHIFSESRNELLVAKNTLLSSEEHPKHG